MSDAKHLTEDQLIRAIDSETTPAEKASVETHLAQCDLCVERYESMVDFSNELEKVVEATAVHVPHGARERLVSALAQAAPVTPFRSGRLPHAWQWVAVAASALVLLFVLGRRQPTAPEAGRIVRPQQPLPAVAPASTPVQPMTPARVSRSTAPKKPRPQMGPRRALPIPEQPAFVPLPYLDNGEPVQTAGVVRVEMKLSMLANAGVIRIMPGASDVPVQADLLLGLDGQPYAIRLVSNQ